MKKILVIGSKGMAGHMITRYLESRNKYDVYCTLRADKNMHLGNKVFNLDAFDTPKLKEILEKVKPDYVINCIGILNKEAELNPDIAIYVNGYFPQLLDRLSKQYSYKLIHITTDCVFSGEKGSYVENDFRDATSYYGRSKAIGEVNNDRTLTFRTSIIGPDINENGIGLFNWFLHQNGEINGYTNVYWSGVTTLELAKAIEASFNQNITGIYHLTNNQKISKYDLLNLFNKYTNKNLKINKFEDYFCDKSLMDTRKTFQHEVPSYDEMIKEMVYITHGYKMS